MERAEPSIIRVAASRSIALKSFIFFSAIARSCSRVIEPADLAARQLGTGLQAQGLLDEEGRRRRLGDEGERLVLIHRDDGRERRAFFDIFRTGVEFPYRNP